MKFWFEAVLEKKDDPKTCVECGGILSEPDHVFVEFELHQGSMPNPGQLHPEPTGRFLCPECSVRTLI